MTSLSVVALELLAFFGFLGVLCNILLPMVVFVLRFLLADVPREWRNLLLHRAQQRELRRLQRRVDVLTRKKQAEKQESRRRARAASAHKATVDRGDAYKGNCGWTAHYRPGS